MRLAKLVKAYRLTHNLGLRELGEKIGVTEIQMFRFEQGRSVRHETLCLIINWALSRG